MCLFHDATVFGCLHGACAWLTAGRMLSSEGRRRVVLLMWPLQLGQWMQHVNSARHAYVNLVPTWKHPPAS